MDELLQKLAEKNGITLPDTDIPTNDRLDALEEAVLDIIIGGDR